MGKGSVFPLDQLVNMEFELQAHLRLVEEQQVEVEPVLHSVSRISKR